MVLLSDAEIFSVSDIADGRYCDGHTMLSCRYEATRLCLNLIISIPYDMIIGVCDYKLM